MTAGSLFLSFWHICLDNLPEGDFVRRRISAADASRQIKRARREGVLHCLSEKDLVAPYHADERDNYAALCRVLESAYDIRLGLADFIPTHSDGKDSFYSILPLSVAKVKKNDRLLVVNCSYGLQESGSLALELAPETAEFHLIEASSRP